MLLSPVLILFQERHRHEVQAFQARLREQEDTIEKLQHKNQVLSSELSQALKNNDKYQSDLKQINEQWKSFNQDLKSKQEQSVIESGLEQPAEAAKVWSDVLQLRRQWMDLKMNTQQDLLKVQNDISNATRQISQACVDMTSTGQASSVSPGQNEVWTQLQKCRHDRHLLEQKVLSLEHEIVRCKGSSQLMEQSLRDERIEMEKMTEKNEKLTSELNSYQDTLANLNQMTKDKSALENSLVGISQLVEDFDQDEVDLSLETFHAPKVVKFAQ